MGLKMSAAFDLMVMFTIALSLSVITLRPSAAQEDYLHVTTLRRSHSQLRFEIIPDKVRAHQL